MFMNRGGHEYKIQNTKRTPASSMQIAETSQKINFNI